MTELEAVLRPHFEAHQRESGRKAALESRVKRIQNDRNEYALAVGLSGVSLHKDKDNNSNTNLQQQEEELAQCLLKFLDCAVACVVQTQDASSDAVRAVLELTTAVAAATSVAVCHTVLQRIVHLSDNQVDLVRVVACRAVGAMVSFILASPQRRANNNTNKQASTTAFNDILDAASQALLPRFTDKTQSVRLAAIQSARHFFFAANDTDDHTTTTTTDPDLLQALLWSLQHDPSVANREAAAQHLPVTLQTVDFLVQRVRDTKRRVRVAALRALRENCRDLTLLEPGQCAALVQAGWTNRYVVWSSLFCVFL